MSKRKPKVQPVEDTPQPMSDARLKHVREIMERGARVGIELSHSLTQEVLNEIDRLRAEVAAKDAALSAADKLAAACANSLKPPERIQIDMPELVLDYKRARKATP